MHLSARRCADAALDVVKVERVAESLFGLHLDQEDVDRGAAFVQGVLGRSGELDLARLWLDEEHLPTPAEVEAPGLWLARINLEEKDL